MSENNVLLLPAKAFAFTPRIIPMPKIFRSPANPCPHRRSMAAREQCGVVEGNRLVQKAVATGHPTVSGR